MPTLVWSALVAQLVSERMFIFVFFHMTQFIYKLIKVSMVCLGLEPRAAGWKAQTNPLRYCGTL